MSNCIYIPPNPDNWKGRIDGEEKLYWHQHVVLQNAVDAESLSATVALLGYAGDEGAIRNQGRAGSALGPDAIRKKLAPLAFHLPNHSITDIGNFAVNEHGLEGLQNDYALVVSTIIQQQCLPVCFGGSHDISFASFSGLLNALKDQRIGIINFDAHFDLRKPAPLPTSGTPFYQNCEAVGKIDGGFQYFVLGIQQAANNKLLFETAYQSGTTWMLAEDCDNPQQMAMLVREFIKQVDVVHLSIDLDVFSSAFAPGVSAPSPFGIAPSVILPSLAAIAHSGKLRLVDIAELNPKFDRDDQTASLAARLVEYLLKQFDH